VDVKNLLNFVKGIDVSDDLKIYIRIEEIIIQLSMDINPILIMKVIRMYIIPLIDLQIDGDISGSID